MLNFKAIKLCIYIFCEVKKENLTPINPLRRSKKLTYILAAYISEMAEFNQIGVRPSLPGGQLYCKYDMLWSLD